MHHYTIRFTLTLAFTLALALAACGKKKDKEDKKNTPPAGPAMAAVMKAPAAMRVAPRKAPPRRVVARPAAPVGPKGLKAKGNNPKLVELAAPVTKCNLKASHPAYSCKALKPFNAAFDKTKAADVATLINLLEDPSEHVRWLGLYALINGLVMQGAEGRKGSDRLLAAATAEKSAAVAKLFGPVILQADTKLAANVTKIKALASGHALAEMRGGIMRNLYAQDNKTYFPFMAAQLAKETSSLVKVAILSAFYTGSLHDAAAVCKLSLERLDDKDAKVANQATYNIAWGGKSCAAHFDAVNKSYAARVKAGKVPYMYWLKVQYLYQNKAASDAQKQAFLETTKALVAQPKVGGMVRSNALSFAVKKGKLGKAFARKFLKDKEKWVADEAKKLSK